MYVYMYIDVCIYVYIDGYRETGFKEFAHMIVEVCQVHTLQARPVGWKSREGLQFESKSSLWAEFPLLERSIFSVMAFN